MIPRFLPVAPRPFDDELLSSWQGRIACRYDLCADDLSERLGVVPHERPIGFSGRDFAPGSAAVSAWARACRVSEGRVRDMALSTGRRPVGLYVWGEGRAVGAIRRPVCPACLDEDADAGRDHHIRRTWALVESCSCDRHGRFLSETCAHCPSLLGFRFRNRGGARLVCIQCQSAVRGLAAADAASPGIQGFFRMLSSLFAEPVDSFPSTASAVLRAARLLWAPPRARGRSRTPYIARVASDVPSPPRTGAAQDRTEPLATASLGWRMVTLLGVAQLLDLGGARQGSGSAPFTLDQLAEWTGEDHPESRARSARAVAVGPVLRPGGPLRAPEEYRRLAETILASEEWQNSRAGPPVVRQRTLGLLMNRALSAGARGRPELRPVGIRGTGRQKRVENYGTARRTDFEPLPRVGAAS
jgi:TniQ